MRYEFCLFATIGSFVGILLIEAITTTHTVFQDVYHSPIIIASFGASAVLIFGVPEAPLVQPRNAILGQLISAIIGTAITRLWIITNPDYVDHLGNKDFYAPAFVNGALCMSIALLGQLVFDILHPPGGATALAAAIEPAIVAISWDYVPIVLASSVIMVAWALLMNNLGRRRYPVCWWIVGQNFVKDAEKELNDLEDGTRSFDLERPGDVEVLGENLAMARTQNRRAWN